MSNDRIKEALSKLDVNNDNHWTADGLPRLDTVKMLSGNPGLTRDAVSSAAPEFNRAYATEQSAKPQNAEGTGEAAPAPNAHAVEGAPRDEEVQAVGDEARASNAEGDTVTTGAQVSPEVNRAATQAAVAGPAPAGGTPVQGPLNRSLPAAALASAAADTGPFVPPATADSHNMQQSNAIIIDNPEGKPVDEGSIQLNPAPLAEGEGDYEDLTARLEEARTNLSDRMEALAKAKEEVAEAQNEVARLEGQSIAAAPAGTDPIRSYLNSQQKALQERGRRNQMIRESGIDLKALAEGMKAPIDRARERKGR